MQLKECLKALSEIKSNLVELVIVAGGEVADLIKSYKLHNLKFITFQGEKNDARNKGFLNSSGKYILYIDHDMILTKELVDEILSLRMIADAYYITEKGIINKNVLSRIYTFEKGLYVKDQNSETPRIFKRSLFSEHQLPFNKFYGQSDEWGFWINLNKKNLKISRLKNPIHISFDHFTLIQSMIKKFWMGFYSIRVASKGTEGIKRINLYDRSIKNIFKNVENIYKEPFVFFGYCFVKLIELIAFIVGMIYQKNQKTIDTLVKFSIKFSVLIFALSDKFLVRKIDLLVINYHEIGNHDDDYTVDKNTFIRQINYINNIYRFVLPDRFFSFANKFKGNYMLTFDDGLKSVLSIVEELNKLAIKPTVFINSNNLMNKKQGKVYLNVLDLKRLKAEGWTIGSHNHTHRDMTQISPEEASVDIILSKMLLSKYIGIKTKYFAYPHGQHNENMVKLLKVNKFKAAFTTENNYYSKLKDNRFKIQRINVKHNDGEDLFKLKISPTFLYIKKIISTNGK